MVVLIGALDTKGAEVAFVRDRFLRAGLTPMIMDVGCLGEPTIAADIPRAAVFAAAGASLDQLRQQRDRGEAVRLAGIGAERLIVELQQQGKLAGVFGLGGSAGTSIATQAMRALPIGVPKLMLSTMTAGQIRPFVGVKDILMMPTITDLTGLNRVSRTILANAAGAFIGMVKAREIPHEATTDRPIITLTMFGVTTPCVQQCQALLEPMGYETLVFHAVGVGGQTMEGLITDGMTAGVIDVTTTELADELVGGVLSAGPDRLTAAACAGVPQVVSVGALDMVNFGPRDAVPSQFRDRQFYQHNPSITLMRTTPAENATLGRQICDKLAGGVAPTAIVVPRRGVSALDCDGQPFWDPVADAALFDALRKHCPINVRLVEVDRHINDPEFSQVLVQTLRELLAPDAARADKCDDRGGKERGPARSERPK